MAIQSPSLDLGGGAGVRATPAAQVRGYWQQVGRRLRRDPVTLVCAVVLLLIVASALAAPWLGVAGPHQTAPVRRPLSGGAPAPLPGGRWAGRRSRLPLGPRRRVSS